MRDSGLTPKETEVVVQLLLGKSRKQIAHALNIKTGTIDTHFRSIFVKTQSRSIVETTIWAFKNGFGIK